MTESDTALKVLVADDDFLVTEMIEDMLNGIGCKCVGRAVNGRDAVEKTQNLRPDVVLMDIKMPDLDGLEAARQIQESCPTPVAVLTAYESRELAAASTAAGIGAYIMKPPNPLELQRAILIARTRFEEMMELRRLNQLEQTHNEALAAAVAELESVNSDLEREIKARNLVEQSLGASEERFRTILDKSHLMINSFAPDGRCLLWNKESERTLGWTQEEVRASNEPLALFYPDSDARTTVAESIKRADGVFRECSVSAKDGSTRVQMWANFRLPTGALLSVGHDITARKQAEQCLEHRLEFEATIAAISSRFIGIYDIDGAINESLAEIGRLSGAGRAYVFLFRDDGETMDNTHEWIADGVLPEMENLQNLTISNFEWVMTRLRRGETVHIADTSTLPAEAKEERSIFESQNIKSLLLMPLTIGDQVSGFMGFDNVVAAGSWSEVDHLLLRVSSEIIGNAFERLRYEEKLRAQSMTDELTGLYNRRGLKLLGDQQIHTATRIGLDIWLAFVDLDGLKNINDQLGHRAGDQALIDTASLLKKLSRRADLIARLGGDEFVLMGMALSGADMSLLARRLQADLEVFNKSGQRQFQLSLSHGIVQYSAKQSDSLDELLKEADAMMYEEKRKKNGRICRT